MRYQKPWKISKRGEPNFIPIERTTQIFEYLIGHRISFAPVLSACGELSEQIEPAIDAVSAQLKQSIAFPKNLSNLNRRALANFVLERSTSEVFGQNIYLKYYTVVNFDESSLRVKGKLHWLHYASTSLLTHYDIHAKRGVEAIEDAGILTEFSGTAVHGHWKPYFKDENCRHALCNAHHLRELKYIEKQYQQSWATSMSTLLLEIKATVEKTNPQVSSLPPSQLKMFEKQYDEIVKQGFDVNPQEPPKVGENKKWDAPNKSRCSIC
jgi:hypothetical protein